MTTPRPVPSLATSPLALAVAALAGCLGGGAPVGEQPGSIHGVIDYAGAERGPLRIAAFASFPPRGLPAAQTTIALPSFPQAYELVGLPPGRYFVLALVDTAPDDGVRYRPRVDPGGTYGRYDSPVAITLEVGQPALDIDLELAPPTPSSPWDH